MSLVEKIKKLCKENKTSIAKLEKELGFSNGSLYKWGTSNPSIDKVQKVAKYFNVSIESLLYGAEKLEPMPEPFNKQTVLKLAKDNGVSIGRIITVLEEVKSTILDEMTV